MDDVNSGIVVVIHDEIDDAVVTKNRIAAITAIDRIVGQTTEEEVVTPATCNRIITPSDNVGRFKLENRTSIRGPDPTCSLNPRDDSVVTENRILILTAIDRVPAGSSRRNDFKCCVNLCQSVRRVRIERCNLVFRKQL